MLLCIKLQKCMQMHIVKNGIISEVMFCLNHMLYIFMLTAITAVPSATYQVCSYFLAKYPVLVSAGREFIFFLVAGVVLCFGFGMKMMLIMLISPPCPAVARPSRTFQLLTLAWAARCIGSWGEDTARTADPNWPKGYCKACDVMLSV